MVAEYHRVLAEDAERFEADGWAVVGGHVFADGGERNTSLLMHRKADYGTFLAGKTPRMEADGIEPGPVHSMLFSFQADLVRWALRRGRAAIFADCGLGKSFMQLEWARQMGRTLIVAPIAVAHQTIAEANKLGLRVRRVLEPDDAPGISITNYERLHHFAGAPYDAIVLDESSILKSVDGKTRTMLLQQFTGIKHRLCCTATPAPNDVSELANHAEFLGAMPRVEMLASFFVHEDGREGWRLKGHGADVFWRWVAGWAAFVRKPSDLGYSDDGFGLPPLSVRDEVVSTDWKPAGMLVATGLGGVGSRQKVRKYTLDARAARAAEIIANTPGQWLVWCGLNDEGRKLKAALGDDAVLIEGKDDEDTKSEREWRWRNGEVRTLISKAAIFGFGLNWQHCHRMLFLGIGDSYEQYYQSIRRCWRFGQKEPVDVRIVASTAEGEIAANVRRKEQEAADMAEGVVRALRDEQIAEVRGTAARSSEYKTTEATGDGWRLMLGDCVERIREIADGSVGLSVYSPPFASLYTYSATERDMGNSRDYDQFFRHYGFLVPEILRVTKPGRRTAVHVQQVTTTKNTNGVIGWRDFRADMVKAYTAAGWVYDGEIVIDKDPQAQAIRTKSKQLMFVQKERDSSWLRPAMADYILLFRHPLANLEPVKSDVTNDEWILWARPIWYGIRESDTLQAAAARSDKDEKHICPLQLGTIERCIRLWSNPGDTVLSPFAGIGSEGYVALRHGRRYIGIELKEEYFTVARRNLAGAVAQQSLF
jgi:DNA modification methylase